MTEELCPINGYEGLYAVTRSGKIYSYKTNKYLKLVKLKIGYCAVSLFKNNEAKQAYIHRLVAIAFIPNTEGKPVINHINGIKTDNRVENLEWCTYSENITHSYKTTTTRLGANAQLTPELVKEIKNLLCENVLTQKEIATKYNVSRKVVGNINIGKSYKYLFNNIDMSISKKLYIKLTLKDYQTIKNLDKTGRYTRKAIAQMFGVSQTHVTRILNNERYLKYIHIKGGG